MTQETKFPFTTRDDGLDDLRLQFYRFAKEMGFSKEDCEKIIEDTDKEVKFFLAMPPDQRLVEINKIEEDIGKLIQDINYNGVNVLPQKKDIN